MDRSILGKNAQNSGRSENLAKRHSNNFAQLLGDKMISGDVVDMMMEHLAEHIEADEDTSRTYRITTLSFQDHISKAWDSQKSNRQ